MSKISIPKHIYWSGRGSATVDTGDPTQKKWFLEQTLVHGTMADIRALNLAEVARMLPGLHLPRHVKALWRDYFECLDTDAVSSEGS